MPEEFDPTDHPLTDFISNPDFFSFFVAFVAGIAGVLSLTSAKSGALIGVLISVTTIPAAANIGVAAALGEWGEAGGAALQLGLNLVAIVLAGVVTLFLQRRWYVSRRRKHLHDPVREAAGLPLGRRRSRSSVIITHAAVRRRSPSDDQASIFTRTRAITSSVNSVVEACPARSGVRTPGRHGLEHALVDRARGRSASAGVVQQRGAGQDHRHRVGDVLAQQRGRGAVRRLGHHGRGLVVGVQRQQHGLGARRSSRTSAARSPTGSRRRG